MRLCIDIARLYLHRQWCVQRRHLHTCTSTPMSACTSTPAAMVLMRTERNASIGLGVS